MLRATGCQGGRTGSHPGSGGGRRVRAGGGYEIQEGSAAEALTSVNRKYGACAGFPRFPQAL
jgi:hypothetical protein